MRRPIHRAVALVATALTLVLTQWKARSSEPVPSAIASASASAAPRRYPPISAVSWPSEASKPPSLEEWKSPENLSARGGAAGACSIRRVREWVRVRCFEGNTRELEQIAGPQVHAMAVESPPGAYAGVGAGGTVFPVRRGDRRVLQWLVPRYTSVVESESGLVLTEQWLPEEPAPSITIDVVEQHRGPVTGY